MKYLPFENIIYRTELDSEEILQRLNENIEPKKTFRMTKIFGDNNHKPYEGDISGVSFNITRIISYRNSFMPIIKGNIEKDFNVTKINVKMRLHPLVLAFVLIWCGVIGVACLGILISSVSKGNFDPIALIPFGMILFGYGLTTASFKYESKKSKKYLAQLFEAKIEN